MPGLLEFLSFIIVGLIAGWVAGLIMRGHGFGVLGNIVVGIVGAVLGGVIFNALGFATAGFLGSLIVATVGAVVLLFIAGLFRRQPHTAS